MNGQKELSERFEANRARLKAVAHRMLGSEGEAEDAVQEAWLRLSRADAGSLDNLSGWLTTVVARVCLDMLRARASRREAPLDTSIEAHADEAIDAERDMAVADGVGLALMVVLDTLEPAERVAFVLHDMFDLAFDEIAPIVGRTVPAARQLASRARRRVRGSSASSDHDRTRQREIVAAFLAASRAGDLGALLALLDPNVVLRADQIAIAVARQSPEGVPLAPEIAGADAVADIFRSRGRTALMALIDGDAGLIFAPGGTPRVAVLFARAGEQITNIEFIAEPERLGELELEILGD